MTVADIRTTSGDWNEELIRGIFCPFYVEAILRINRRIIGEDFWSCPPPPTQVWVFWWRAIHGFLPARQVLYPRHIERIANCETRGAQEETIKHVLTDCTVARQFWGSTKELSGVKLPSLHESTWTRDLLQPDICPRKNAAIIMYGMWSLWMQRNNRRHGEESC
jgi:hypothetical protein